MEVWGRVRFGRPLDDGKGGPHQGRDKKESSKVGRQRFNPSHKHVKHKVPSEPRARKTQGSIRATNTKNTGQIFKARTAQCVGAAVLARQHQLAKDKIHRRVPDVQRTSRPRAVPGETNKSRRRDQYDHRLYVCVPQFWDTSFG